MNSRGIGIVETIVYSLLLGISLLAALVIISTNVGFSTAFNDRVQSEEDLFLVESYLKTYMSQALRITNAATPSAGNGSIRMFDSNTMTSDLIRFGLFEREASLLRRPPPGNDSLIRNTGLYFIRPRLVGTREYGGVLMIDPGTRADGRVEANFTTNITTGNLVRLRVFNPRSTSTSPSLPSRLMSVDIEVETREYPVNHPRGQRCYRPIGCPPEKLGRRSSRVFTILFRNNTFGDHPTIGAGYQEGTLGNLYFFQLFKGN